jgi:glycosyltransferase involved in cell wall biosynthesis
VAFAAKTLKNTFGIPLVCTLHATESGRNWGIHNDIQRYISGVEWWLSYESWRVIVNSNYMMNEAKSVFNLPEDKLRVIPNGVNLNKFDGFERDYEFRRRFAMDNEKIVFFVGRLVNEKGAQILIDAVPKVLQYYYDTKFIIAGRGPQMDHLKWMVSSRNVSHKVYFTGYIGDEDLLKLYKCADIAVFPSLYEPFGIVALEGMVANIPVVVSDTGGLGEIVHHGIDGMKAYTGNANSLGDCILELLFNTEKAEDMSRKALEKVRRIYNWDIISEQTMQVYREIEEDCKRSGWRIPNLKEQLDNL